MGISSPENTPAGRRKAIEELQRGFEHAKQLQILLSNKSSSGDNGMSACLSSRDLLERITSSFSDAISVLRNVEFNEASQTPASWKLEDSEGSSKSTTTVRDRRGCYKRRKTEGSWKVDTPNWVEDAFAWRKYGQKVILNCKYPRHYYRCTHKSDGCPATKQIQQIGDNPPVHRTTYYGNHTCQDLLNTTQIFMEAHDSAAGSCMILSFDNNSSKLTNNQQDDNDVNPFFSSAALSIKEEHSIDQYHPCNLTQNQSSSSDYLFSPDELTAFGSSLSSDHADVISCAASAYHQDFDLGSIDHFEEDILKQYGFESL